MLISNKTGLFGNAQSGCNGNFALSSKAMSRYIEQGLQAGFFRYLTKPIKINEFMVARVEALKLSNSADK